MPKKYIVVSEKQHHPYQVENAVRCIQEKGFIITDIDYVKKAWLYDGISETHIYYDYESR